MPCTGRVAITWAAAVNLRGQAMDKRAYLAKGVWVNMYRAEALEVRECGSWDREGVRRICGYTA
jgi:hypothetical protein